jgi:ADP-ribose pyrophosphatase YjhB (NUDIX family)
MEVAPSEAVGDSIGQVLFRGSADSSLENRDDPDWLVWARELLATAQSGMTFAKDPYDRERYEGVRRLGVRILAAHTGTSSDRIESLFASETGYATPKIGVRGAVFDADGRLLMVRESADHHRWTLPGGWAEVNQTPAESVVREIFEESGYRAQPLKLAAVWDRARQPHAPSPYSVVRMFFICALRGGTPRTSLETSGHGWFHEPEVPGDLSLVRTQPHHIARMFAHWREPGLPTEFDRVDPAALTASD